MNARRLNLAALITLCVTLGALTLSTVPAAALSTHVFSSSFGGSGSEAGELSSPEGVAVNAVTHDVYVADKGNVRVDEFSSSGAFIRAWGWGVADGLPKFETCTLVCQRGISGSGAGQFTAPVFVAVDNSAGPSSGDVYVGDTGDFLVSKFTAAGALVESWGTKGQLDGSTATDGPFGSIAGIAVDAGGTLMVMRESDSHLFKFAEGGSFNEDFEVVRGTSASGLAVDSKGNFFKVNGTPDVEEVTGTNSDVGQVTASESATGIAVDSTTGDLYVDESGDIEHYAFAGAGIVNEQGATTCTFEPFLGCPATDTFGAGGTLSGGAGLGVDPTNTNVYVADRSADKIDVFIAGVIPDVALGATSERKAQSATLNGTVNPDGEGAVTCRFEYGPTLAYGESVPCSAGVPSGNGPVSVSAEVSGLQSDTVYHFRLGATNAHGTNTSPGGEFKTGGPGIASESSADVAASSATIQAQIDPNGVDTHYYFQYGTSTAYGSDLPTPPGGEILAGGGEQSVSVHLQGLQPATVYHYRVVAESELTPGEVEAFDGPDETFTTQSTGTASALPDGRTWEMVTPPYKQGAGLIAIGNEQGADIQAAADGGAITYVADAPFVANPAGSRSLEVTQVFSNREVPGGWATRDITTAHDEGSSPPAIGRAAEYKLFSSDLSLGLVEPQGDTPLPPLPAGSERTSYLRESSGEYQALVTSANVPTGTKFGGTGEEVDGTLTFVSASPDLSHVVLDSQVGLTSTPGDEGGLYEWADGQLQLASVLPGGEPESSKVSLGVRNELVRHAISNDGSRIIFTGFTFAAGNVGHIYLRDMVKGESVQVDAAQGAPEGAAASSYSTASSDGSRVFFTSPERLTADATASGGGEDLYVFEVTSGQGEPLAGRLKDLTVDGNVGESTGVQGVIGAGEEGSSVYFVANGVLGNGAGHGAEEGGDNLYVEHYDEGTKAWAPPVFIAALSSEDNPSWGVGPGNLDLKNMTSRVSPNGRYLAFMSERSLTGYDNRDASSGVRDEEVFLYDASNGRVVCASCDPSGARPVGLFKGEGYEERLVDYTRGLWDNRWLAGNIPGWDTTDLGHSLYQSRYLSDSGRLFFNSADTLVPGDVNGKEDVYEYEPAGLGSCQGEGHGQNAGVVFSEGAGGCVGLISAGTSGEESAFMDASESGGDVFFLTSSHLSPADKDTSVDVYDAHECTASLPCAPVVALTPPPCTTGDACKAAPTPQPAVFGAPASATFSGAGNLTSTPVAAVKVKAKPLTRAQKLTGALKVCKRQARRKRGRCEVQARKKYGTAHKAKKTDRRAK